jgi:hypothetical protein
MPSGSWKENNIDENKIYAEAKEFWNKYFKNSGLTLDVYMAEIYQRMKVYAVMPKEDQQKFLESQLKLLDRAEHAIQQVKKREDYGK